jgi:hypothetical protein
MEAKSFSLHLVFLATVLAQIRMQITANANANARQMHYRDWLLLVVTCYLLRVDS